MLKVTRSGDRNARVRNGRPELAHLQPHVLPHARAAGARDVQHEDALLTSGDNSRSASGAKDRIRSHANPIGSGSESYGVFRPRGPGGPLALLS